MYQDTFRDTPNFHDPKITHTLETHPRERRQKQAHHHHTVDRLFQFIPHYLWQWRCHYLGHYIIFVIRTFTHAQQYFVSHTPCLYFTCYLEWISTKSDF